jgi:hypothetical protein
MKPAPFQCDCGRNQLVMSPESKAFYDAAIAAKHPNLAGVLMNIKMYERECKAAREAYEQRLEAAQRRFLPKPPEPVDEEQEAVKALLMPFVSSFRTISHLHARAVKADGRWCIEIKAPQAVLEAAPDTLKGLAVIKVCDC